MAKRPYAPDVVAATLVVAASNSLHPERADYRCTGINDHLVIQAALDALPATGGEVVLLDGTYHIEVSLSLDSYQTLRGCGRNTILTTTTADLDIIMATGGLGTEKIGIVIADLCIDGNAGGVANDIGIKWTYVDHGKILNCWILDNGEHGINLINCDYSIVFGNICQGNAQNGIYLYTCYQANTIIGNTCLGNNYNGIRLYITKYSTVVGNTCQGNNAAGIYLYTAIYNTIIGNICQENLQYGIYINDSSHNTITSNTLSGNSQTATNTTDDICLESSDYNNIQGNTCRAGVLANKPRYGINISTAACDCNLVTDNDLYNDGFGTAPFNDAGTGTRLNVYLVPFVSGNDPQDSGFLIDAAAEYARAFLRLPPHVSQVVRMKVYARITITETDRMLADFTIYGSADNEAYNTHDGSVASLQSTTINFTTNDIGYWTITTAGVLALIGGDSIQVKVLHRIAGGADCQTGGYFRTVEIEYV